MNGTNWTPGLMVLAAGLLAGVLFVILSRRGKSGAADTPGTLEDFEQRYQSLIAQLKELIGARHQLPAAQFEAEKSRLEQAAAAALKARDQFVKGGQLASSKGQARPSTLPAGPQAKGAGMFSPRVQAVVIGVGAIAFFAFVGVMLSQESTARTDKGGMTGRGPGGDMEGGPDEAAMPPEGNALKQAMTRLNDNPDDLQALGEAAHLLIVSDDYEHAAMLTDRAMGIDPFHVETRVHRAVLRATKGDSAGALTELLHLADTFPDSGEALLFAGAVALQLKDKPQALEAFERYWAAAAPSDRSAQLGQQIEALRREVGQKGSP